MEALLIVTITIALLFILGVLSDMFGVDSRESVGDDWARRLGA